MFVLMSVVEFSAATASFIFKPQTIVCNKKNLVFRRLCLFVYVNCEQVWVGLIPQPRSPAK
jgi:hypothetical protein